jgi:hypothetical protein
MNSEASISSIILLYISQCIYTYCNIYLYFSVLFKNLIGCVLAYISNFPGPGNIYIIPFMSDLAESTVWIFFGQLRFFLQVKNFPA